MAWFEKKVILMRFSFFKWICESLISVNIVEVCFLENLSLRKKDKQRWQYAMLHFYIFLTICTNLTQFLYIIDSNNNVTYEIWEYFSFNNLWGFFRDSWLKKNRVWTKYHKQLQIMGDYLYVLNPLLSKTHYNSKYWHCHMMQSWLPPLHSR